MCESCRLTRTRPADNDTEGMAELVRAEKAKRRLVFELAELGLPVARRDPATGRGLAFDLLSSVATKVVTGHDDGVITLDLAEADDEHREQLRRRLDEPYRTLLGHFRHEIGHYYWPLLVTDDDTLASCRALFGDDRADYGEAVKHHYASPPVLGWEDDYISRYATMHPYEDWAETFAHYLHIVDVMQVADSFGIGRPRPRPPAGRPRPPARSHPTGWQSVVGGRRRRLAGADVCPQSDQPFDGVRGPLPVRPGTEGDREAGLRRRGRPAGPRRRPRRPLDPRLSAGG